MGQIIVARSATESAKQMEIGGAPYDPPGGYSKSKKSISSGGLLLFLTVSANFFHRFPLNPESQCISFLNSRFHPKFKLIVKSRTSLI